MFHRTELKHRHLVTDEIASAAIETGHRFFDADLCLSRVVLWRSHVFVAERDKPVSDHVSTARVVRRQANAGHTWNLAHPS